MPNPLSNDGAIVGPEQTQSFPSDKNDFEPRLGFAYDVRGSGRTTIRGGYGIYHGRIPNAMIAFAINETGTAESQRTFQFIPARSASVAPVFPNTFTGPPSAEVSPNLTVFDPNMDRPSVRESDLVFEHDLGSNTVLSAAYLYTAGRDLPTFIDVNLPAPTSRTYAIIGGDFDGQTLTVSPFFGGARPDERFGTIMAVRSLIKSKYHAVAVQLNRRLTRGLQFESSYTLSKATDNGQSSTIASAALPFGAVVPGSNYPSNPLDLTADQGPSNFDVRHKFTANAVWSTASVWSNNKAGARNLQRLHRCPRLLCHVWSTVFGWCRREGGRWPASGHQRRRTAQSQSFPVVLAQRLPAAEDRQRGSPDLAAVSDNEQREPGDSC